MPSKAHFEPAEIARAAHADAAALADPARRFEGDALALGASPRHAPRELQTNPRLGAKQLEVLSAGVKSAHRLRAVELARAGLTGDAGEPVHPPLGWALADERARRATPRAMVAHHTSAHGAGAFEREAADEHDQRGVLALDVALRCGSRVERLDLRASGLRETEGRLLRRLLSDAHAPPLTSLEIGGNALGDAGVAAVADGLRRNARLRRLGLERTGIGATGAAALADALAVNTALRALGLAHNRCGASGVAALAGALRLTAAPLRELDLEHHGAALGGGGTAVDALAAALGGDAPLPPTLRHLRLAGNGLGVASRRRLRAALEARRPRQRVALGFGAKQTAAAAAAARAADLEEEFDEDDDDEDDEMLEVDESSDEELSAHAGRSVSFR